MKKQFKKTIIPSIILLTIILTSTFIIAQQEQELPAFNVCCERTDNGAWCQNAPEAECDESYRTTPTSCEATSFCKLGCCVDSSEGLCMKNTPQKVCEVSTGTWLEDEECNVPQCSLGCCLLGDQASFVTLTRCKRLASIYGLNTNFKTDVSSEAACIDLAFAQDHGACVYEIEDMKTCKFTTRGECTITKSGNLSGETRFFKDLLCSADELATDCGPTKETMCVPEKDEVYFKDSCGNPANIYDSSKTYSKDPSYWTNVVPKQESCGYNKDNGNVKSKSCGNCEYLQGSICGKGSATHGNNICKDLNCYQTKNGENYKNGESWCVYQGDIDNGKDLVGSRHFRHVCIHGEEVIEACADFRNEICIEGEMDTMHGDFIEAACRTNRWEDCINQFDGDDCLNLDKRECFWASGLHYDGSSESGKSKSLREEALASQDLEGQSQGILSGGNICLPNNPPGLQFWDSSDASSVCALGNSKQIVKFSTNIFGKISCKENCEVLGAPWVRKMNDVCKSLGDCGAYKNIAGKFTNKGAIWKSNGQRKVLTGILGGLKQASQASEANTQTQSGSENEDDVNSEETIDPDRTTENPFEGESE
jgi:hypothetical protein